MVTRIKSREVSSDQGALFTPEEILYKNAPVATEIAVQPMASTEVDLGTPGVSVDFETREDNILKSFQEIATANGKRGFLKISDTSSPRRGEFENLYGDELPGKRMGAREKVINSEIQARKDFSSALGAFALVESGVISKEDAIKMERVEFDEFSEVFKDSKKRNKLERTIIRNRMLRAKDKAEKDKAEQQSEVE